MGTAMIIVLLRLESLWYEERGDGIGIDEINGFCEGRCLIYEIVVARYRNKRPQQRRLDFCFSSIWKMRMTWCIDRYRGGNC